MLESGAVPEGWLFGNSEYPWRPNLTRGKIQKTLHQSKKYSETKFMVFSNLDLDAFKKWGNCKIIHQRRDLFISYDGVAQYCGF